MPILWHHKGGANLYLTSTVHASVEAAKINFVVALISIMLCCLCTITICWVWGTPQRDRRPIPQFSVLWRQNNDVLQRALVFLSLRPCLLSFKQSHINVNIFPRKFSIRCASNFVFYSSGISDTVSWKNVGDIQKNHVRRHVGMSTAPPIQEE